MMRLLSIFLGLVLAVQVYSENTMVGQPSEERPATAEVKAMVAGLKGEIESSLALAQQTNGGNGSSGAVRISARSYRSQLVNGMNYFVRVKVSVGKSKPIYYHIKVYKSFSGNVKFVGMTGPKDRKDEIEYFE